ncbi:helix-turn-helix domain-containing protein [Gordonia phthalatica]|uniref:HTH cro/C1-type domain-containing protein n=1 Tax=Gordonia phthalatica TaxID=1136941 RepID=A0A0N9NIE6_9ACTN|nr:helix-turn-helix domain-containing protein [Gordonia phthalatica]ALG87014.1 hypothetical protein ACH46_18190 [Gordonia phthalatica]
MATPRRTKRPANVAMHGFEGIAALVATRRVQLGLTQETLADLAGVSRSSVQAIEYGRASVKLASFIDVLDALGLQMGVETKGRRDE